MLHRARLCKSVLHVQSSLLYCRCITFLPIAPKITWMIRQRQKYAVKHLKIRNDTLGNVLSTRRFSTEMRSWDRIPWKETIPVHQQNIIINLSYWHLFQYQKYFSYLPHHFKHKPFRNTQQFKQKNEQAKPIILLYASPW